MYRNARRRVRVNGTFSDVYQGSVLNPLLFITVLEALSRKIRSGCSEDLLYADELALASETLEGLKGRLEARKGALESKVLRLNVKKTKIMISSENVEIGKTEGKFPSVICGKGVGIYPMPVLQVVGA